MRIKRFSKLFILTCGLLIPQTVLAVEDISDRHKVIANELDCVAKKITQDTQMTWSDVCYMSEEKPKAGNDRLAVINNALNMFEGKKQAKPKLMYQARPAPKRQSYEPKSTVVTDVQSGALRYKYKRRDAYRNEALFSADVSVGAGYRSDGLDWNIAGDTNGANPSVAAEYDWSDLNSYQIKSKARLAYREKLVFDGMFAYADVVSGDNRVSEYEADDKQDEVSRTDNAANDGHMIDYSLGIGYQFDLAEMDDYFELDRFVVTPLVGYGYSEQNLSITDGNQVIDESGVLGLGPFPNLDSPYETEWSGPWFGFELLGERGSLVGNFRFTYHLADYYAQGTNNLQPLFAQPKSFEHKGDGYGYVVSFDLDYKLSDKWGLGFVADWQDFRLTSGSDRLFLAAGGFIDSKLNEVNWRSYSILFDATYHFN